MKVVLQSDIIDRLSPRGILAYVAVALCGKEATVEFLALSVRVKPDLMEDGLKSLGPLQNLELKPQPKKKAAKVEKEFVLPNWIEQDVWDGFEEMRNKIKKPMTNRARTMIVKKLRIDPEFKGQNPNQILDQSTVNGWQDVFPLRDGGKLGSKPRIVETEFAR